MDEVNHRCEVCGAEFLVWTGECPICKARKARENRNMDYLKRLKKAADEIKAKRVKRGRFRNPQPSSEGLNGGGDAQKERRRRRR